jgi:CBS domain containing-hemolysin-like protein
MSYVPTIWIWLGIITCITLSALFAGLNLAIFSLSQLRLQIEADGGNKDAIRCCAAALQSCFCPLWVISGQSDA